ncbi:MAG: indole-3-glycerol phosphate synthase TrpC [Acidimicrobiales bacterium]
MPTTYLDKILAAHRADAAADTRPVGQLIEAARSMPPTRGFADAIRSTDGLAVVSEIKRRSPSKGSIKADVDPAVHARAYETGGATCLSVLTDVEFFGGSPEDLVAARNAVSIPVLRKDFTVSPRDVCDARLMGADAVLLIVAALDDAELADLYSLAVEVGLDALVETHDEAEVERAVNAGARLIGVNQRDLVTFEVDQARAIRVAASLPPGGVWVAESGIGGPVDAAPLARAGYHAVLVGESLMRSGDPATAVGELRNVGKRSA